MDISSIRSYAQDNPLSAVVGIWGIGMVGTLAYVRNLKIPTQLKIINARIVAQFGLISGILMAGGTAMLFHKDDSENRKDNIRNQFRTIVPANPRQLGQQDSKDAAPAEAADAPKAAVAARD